MKRKSIKIATCVIAGTIAIANCKITLEAKINSQNKTVPAAGVAVVLENGNTIEDLQKEVVDNIAYFESVSGIQSNVLISAEDVAMAASPTEEMNTEENTENEEDTNTSEVATEKNTEECTTEVQTEESNIEESESVEESSETELTSEEKTEDESDKKIFGVGLDATVTYDIVKDVDKKDSKKSEAEKEKEDEQDFSGLVIAKVNNYVNVRSLPSEEGEVVGKLYDKSVGEFIEEKDGWYKIKSGNCTGYVKGEYCVVGEDAEKLAKEVGTTYAIVNTTTLKVREEASTESSVLGLVPIEEELVVVEELEGWVKVAIEEGDGYVSREFVNLRTDFVHAESKEEEEERLAKEAKAREEARAAAKAAEEKRKADKEKQEKEKAEQDKNENQDIAPTDNSASGTVVNESKPVTVSEGSDMGKAVIDYATQFVGNPYVYGGSSLTNGTDCSGFVMSVYNNFGVSLPHSSSALRSKGTDVGGLENAQPGDIVCYSGHVGLYAGNGQIVHASTSKTGIIVSNASYRKVLSVRRIF